MRLRNFLLVLIFCLLDLMTRSQTFYRLEYKLQKEGDKTAYSAFFAKFETDEGFIRINYTKEGSKDTNLLQMDAILLYPDINDNNVDTTKLLYQLVNPVIIDQSNGMRLTNRALKPLYDTLFICFKINPVTKFPEPLGISVKQPGMNVNLNNFSKKDTLGVKSLQDDRNYVRKYFYKTEPFYKFLYPRTSRGESAELTDREKSTNLYLLIVADTKDTSIGKSAEVDMNNVVNAFKFILKSFMGGVPVREPVTTIISGDKVSKTNVEKAMNDVMSKVSSNDIFVFYYSGHGFRFNDDVSDFPRMKLWPWNADNKQVWKGDSLIRDYVKNNSLSMDDIYNTVKKKKGRLNLIISDCCNEYILQTTKPVHEPRIPRGEDAYIMNPSREYFRQLFLKNAPVIIRLSATEKGQKAPGNSVKGGAFTNSFLSTLSSFLNGYNTNTISWDALCTKTKVKASSSAKTVVNSKTRAPFKIDPVYKIPE